MKGLWAVYRYEIRQWWMVFPGALALALAVSLFFDDGTRVEASLVTVGIMALVLAPILGSRVLQDDLLFGRMSFFCRLPLSLGAFWLGKVLAALTVLAGAIGLIVVVAVVIGGTWMPSPWYSTMVTAHFLTFLALGHAGSLGKHEASQWSRLNSLGLILLLILLGLSWYWVLEARGITGAGTGRSLESGMFVRWVLALEIILVGAIAIASWVQVIRGRSLPQRGQRAFVLTLWGLLVPVLGVVGVYSLTTPPPSPEHVKQLHTILSAPTGNLVFATGYSARRRAEDSFLLDTASGSFLSLQMASDSLPAFSADGKRAAWFDPDRYLRVADVPSDSSSNGSFRVLPAQIRVSEPLPEIALSPDGRSVALAGLSKVDVFDVSTGRVLSDRYLPGKTTEIRFAKPNLIRLYTADWQEPRQEPMMIYELSLETGALERSGSLEGFGWPGLAVVNADGTRVLRAGALPCGDPTEIEATGGDPYSKAVVDVCLYDGASGAPLADLGEFPKVPLRWARFLVDGRLAMLSLQSPSDADMAQGTLHVFSSEGALQERIDVGRASRFELETQPDPGSLWISTQPGSRLLRVDLDTGTVIQEEGELSFFLLEGGVGPS